MLHRLRKVRQDNRGVAAIEFALLLPFLITLLVGLLETTFKLWSTAKAEKLTVTLSDVISQSNAVTNSDLQALIGAVDKIMDPFPFGAANWVQQNLESRASLGSPEVTTGQVLLNATR